MSGNAGDLSGFSQLGGTRPLTSRSSQGAQVRERDRERGMEFGKLLGRRPAPEHDRQAMEPSAAVVFAPLAAHAAAAAQKAPPPAPSSETRVTDRFAQSADALPNQLDDQSPPRPTDSPTRVSVLLQEAHFAPVNLVLPLDVSDIGGSSADARTPASQAVLAGPQLSSGPLKVLRIRVESEGAEPVDATLRLRQGSLELHLTAASTEELVSLEEGADKLSRGLRQSGYAVKSLVIDKLRPSTAPPTDRHRQLPEADGLRASPVPDHPVLQESQASGARSRRPPAQDEAQSKDKGNERKRAPGRGHRGVYL